MEKECKYCGKPFQARRKEEYACPKEECQKARKSEYRTRLLERDPDYRKKEGKRYYKKHTKRVMRRTKAYRKKHRREYLEYLRKKREPIIKETLGLLGSKCQFCGVPISFGDSHAAHEKEGKGHPSFTSERRLEYIKDNHKDEFVLLCYKCHTGVHFLMEKLGFDWEKILDLKNNNGIR